MKRILIGSFMLSLATSQQLFSAVIFSGNFSTGNGVITLTEPLEFTITGNTGISIIVFDEISFSGSRESTGSPSLLTYMLNGNASQSVTIGDVVDRYASIFTLDLNQNDGYISFDQISAVSGDIVRIQPQSFTVDPVANFDLPAGGVFDGDIYFTDSYGNRVSANAIPEPSSLVLFGLGILSVGSRRRRCK